LAVAAARWPHPLLGTLTRHLKKQAAPTRDAHATPQDSFRGQGTSDRSAAERMYLAHRAGSTADKARLLKLAEAWLDLAERAHDRHRSLRRQTILHPLIEQKLSP
jgi:hypothetical protein